ncbi:hypothetical protein BGZ83_008291 [Gryganskiella cystojenkinii]|nr:hypothetical protein BGZ83_008291 [Gryganskiella cystojenkinii]
MATLYNIFSLIGFPRFLQSDNGKEFVSKIMNEMTDIFHEQHGIVTPYHPRGNGVAEYHVKMAYINIRKECQDQKDKWAKHIPKAQLAMNAKEATHHNSSPYSLFFALASMFNGTSSNLGALVAEPTEKTGTAVAPAEIESDRLGSSST